MKLKDKVAIITGAASGIGRAMAITFAREGAKVVIADVNETRMEETVSVIREAGGQADYVFTDVRKQEDNDNMFSFALETFGSYDILVCNAGVMDGFDLIGNVSDETWERVFSINTYGPMMQMRHAVKYFEEKGSGVIVVVASVAGLGGGRAGVAYTASKHAVLAIAKNTAVAYFKKGIRVNVIAPGGVETHISESMKNVDLEGSQVFNAGMSLMPRMGHPEELADVALFLASEDSRYVNGAIIPVDGGWNAY